MLSLWSSRVRDAIVKPSRNSSWIRLAVPLLLLAALTGVIMYGVHLLIDRAIGEAIRNHARMDAMSWAESFNESLPADAHSLLEGAELTAQQRQVIDGAFLYGNAYAFNVYGTAGQLLYSSDYGVIKDGQAVPANAAARGVAELDRPQVTAIPRKTPDGGFSVFVEAYVPAKHPDGEVLGAIHLYLDKSSVAAPYWKLLDWIGAILPLLFAAVYALPSIAFVWKREEAFAQKKSLRKASRQDPLTGVLNRQTMKAEVAERFADRARYREIGVFFLDVDKFKTINDLHGHEFGDAFLAHVASVLQHNVRESDLVGRMGGDEFVVVLPNATESVLERAGDGILADARKPFTYKGITVQASVSIGQFLAGPGTGARQAQHAADLALYHAKSLGRNSRQPYFSGLDAAMLRRSEIEGRLRQVVETSDFDIHYQPLVAQRDRQIVGFEALLRLRGTDGAPVSPEEFIPVAEDAGLIQELGLKMFQAAVRTAKSWPQDVFLAVNLSPAQFRPGNIDQMISAVLEELDFPASRLELEITENLLMTDEESVSDQLVSLKRMGISIAMDDFGTGYSSLGNLWKYNFDKLKIDRVFLEGFDFENSRYREIVETIVTLGRKLGLKVTVEGVENQRHLEMLDQLDCDQYQGYFFGRPMPAQEALQAALQERLKTARA